MPYEAELELEELQWHISAAVAAQVANRTTLAEHNSDIGLLHNNKVHEPDKKVGMEDLDILHPLPECTMDSQDDE